MSDNSEVAVSRADAALLAVLAGDDERLGVQAAARRVLAAVGHAAPRREWLTLHEVSAILGISTAAVMELVKSGELECRRTRVTHFYVSERSVGDFVAKASS